MDDGVTPDLIAPRALLTGPAVRVAPRLLGSVLRAASPEGDVAVRITEVEAYEGADDPASHAFRGPSRRTAVMFGPPGRIYVYFSYGMHWCANVVCGDDGTAAAVLLRAGEVVEGIGTARQRRPTARHDRDLARGPARLTRCLGLDGAADGTDLCDAGSPVRLYGVGRRRPTGVVAGPRVGISVAADRPWRFLLAGEPSVSAYRRGGRSRAAGEAGVQTRQDGAV